MIDWKQAEQTVIDAILVPQEWLPESYRGKRSHRKLSSVVKQFDRQAPKSVREPDEVSVKFDDKQRITSATPERLARLEKYREAIQSGGEIEYDVNDDKLYRKQLNFMGANPQFWGEDE